MLCNYQKGYKMRTEIQYDENKCHRCTLYTFIGIAVPVLAANDERYSYITINDMKITLEKDHAIIKVNYTIDTVPSSLCICSANRTSKISH